MSYGFVTYFCWFLAVDMLCEQINFAQTPYVYVCIFIYMWLYVHELLCRISCLKLYRNTRFKTYAGLATCLLQLQLQLQVYLRLHHLMLYLLFTFEGTAKIFPCHG